MWALQTHWTAAQALAVFEVLDDLRNLVVDGCARRIRQAGRTKINGQSAMAEKPFETQFVETIIVSSRSIHLNQTRHIALAL